MALTGALQAEPPATAATRFADGGSGNGGVCTLGGTDGGTCGPLRDAGDMTLAGAAPAARATGGGVRVPGRGPIVMRQP